VAPPNRTARVAVLASSAQRSRSDRYPSRVRSAMSRRLVLAGLVLVALALLTISFRSPTSGMLHDVQGYGASALRPFQVAAERVARPFRDGYDYVSGLSSARRENAKLRRMVRDYRALSVGYYAATKENDTLKRLLHYEQGPSYPKDYRPVNASVISFPSGPFDEQLTIGAGSDSGVRLLAPVMSADGLVGHVTNVGPTTARVTLITDPDSSVAAVDLATKVTGLIHRGPAGTLILDRVPKAAVVNKGDLIVTEGTRDRRYPDLYPYGLPIGQVLSANASDIASFLTVQVAPFAKISSLDALVVLVSKKPAPSLP
jgi:rod shape-determining protein MreC